MNQVQLVSPDFIHTVWDKVKPFFDASMQYSNDDYSVDQIKQLLVNGYQRLLVAVENNEIVGMISVEFINYPNNRVMHIAALGGKDVVNEETFSQVEDWARSQGVTKIRAFAHDAQARLYRMKMGFNTVTQVVEKTI